MAQFFKAKKTPPKQRPLQQIDIEQFNHDGQGIGYINNKICFVQGALPGERVKAKLSDEKAKMAKAQCTQVIKANEQRIEPTCQHFALCGGCQLQYASHNYQLTLKRQAVASLFKRFSGIDTLPWQDDLVGQPWGYRRAARVGVWYDNKSKTFTVGFRQQNSKQLTPIAQCPVLVGAYEHLFSAFSQILPTLSVGRFVTHLELVQADNANVVVVRHTKALSKADKQGLLALASQHQWLLLSEYEKGQLSRIDDSPMPALYYDVVVQGSDNTRLNFQVGDFIQINGAINQQMIHQAIDWLALEKNDRLLDLFCGVGNFSLPLARVCQTVVGVEGVDAMVAQASQNAQLNQIDNATFYQADLSVDFAQSNQQKPQWLQTRYDKVLLDPARAGAGEMINMLGTINPQTVLYVSCEPLTLARDSSVLSALGYKIKKIALMDMFSHTRHVEVMALFEQKG